MFDVHGISNWVFFLVIRASSIPLLYINYLFESLCGFVLKEWWLFNALHNLSEGYDLATITYVTYRSFLKYCTCCYYYYVYFYPYHMNVSQNSTHCGTISLFYYSIIKLKRNFCCLFVKECIEYCFTIHLLKLPFLISFRRSRPYVFCKKGVLESFTGKYL